MKTFISATDIETLAAQGVRELAVDEDTVLTAVAPGNGRSARCEVGGAWRSGNHPAAKRPKPAAVFGKPKGCQHGPLGQETVQSPHQAQRLPVRIVDQLIGAVKQLYGRN